MAELVNVSLVNKWTGVEVMYWPNMRRDVAERLREAVAETDTHMEIVFA